MEEGRADVKTSNKIRYFHLVSLIVILSSVPRSVKYNVELVSIRIYNRG